MRRGIVCRGRSGFLDGLFRFHGLDLEWFDTDQFGGESRPASGWPDVHHTLGGYA